MFDDVFGNDVNVDIPDRLQTEEARRILTAYEEERQQERTTIYESVANDHPVFSRYAASAQEEAVEPVEKLATKKGMTEVAEAVVDMGDTFSETGLFETGDETTDAMEQTVQSMENLTEEAEAVESFYINLVSTAPSVAAEHDTTVEEVIRNPAYRDEVFTRVFHNEEEAAEYLETRRETELASMRQMQTGLKQLEEAGVPAEGLAADIPSPEAVADLAEYWEKWDEGRLRTLY